MSEEQTPKWLEELQQRSWEPEILLSGIVLYGMFKVPPLLEKFLAFFKSSLYGTLTDVDNLVGILKLGIYWLIVGLILHLIARGIWVGMVGLSYTFPNGINKSTLKMSGKFAGKLDNLPAFQTTIIRLEKLCSSLFSISFMLFMSTLGGYLYLFVLIVIPFAILIAFASPAIWADSVAFDVYVVVVLVAGVVALLDFVTLGYVRRFRWVARIYWPIHRIISALTLARFYRSIYYAFVSNYNKWVITLILVGFTLTSILSLGTIIDPNETSLSRIALWHSSRGDQVFHGYYDDQNEDRFSVQAQISSDIIDQDVLRLFIPADISKEDSIRSHARYDSLVAASKDTPKSKIDLKAVSQFYHVYLNDSLLKELPWFYHYKVRTSQQGYLAYINIATLPEGVHHVQVGGPPEMYRNLWADIPFYRLIAPAPQREVSVEKKPDEDYLQVKPMLPK